MREAGRDDGSDNLGSGGTGSDVGGDGLTGIRNMERRGADTFSRDGLERFGSWPMVEVGLLFRGGDSKGGSGNAEGEGVGRAASGIEGFAGSTSNDLRLGTSTRVGRAANAVGERGSGPYCLEILLNRSGGRGTPLAREPGGASKRGAGPPTTGGTN
jgi:hypothetical protein